MTDKSIINELKEEIKRLRKYIESSNKTYLNISIENLKLKEQLAQEKYAKEEALMWYEHCAQKLKS